MSDRMRDYNESVAEMEKNTLRLYEQSPEGLKNALTASFTPNWVRHGFPDRKSCIDYVRDVLKKHNEKWERMAKTKKFK